MDEPTPFCLVGKDAQGGSDADWRENFRMSRSTFKQSVYLLHSDIVFCL